MNTSVFTWLIAISPIIIIMVLMILFKKSVMSSALLGLIFVAITGVYVFDATLHQVALEGAKGLKVALPIVYIIWTAAFLYLTCDTAGSFKVIRIKMRSVFRNELLLILAMGWVFSSFLQGITGFGVPLAVTAPLLIAIGVEPVYAVIIPIFGESWGNTFGTLAAAWNSLAITTGLESGSDEYLRTAFYAAAFIMAWNFVSGCMVTIIYGGIRGFKKGLPAIIVLSLIEGGGEIILTRFNTTVACFIPAAAALIAVYLLSYTPMYNKEWKIEESRIMKRAELGEADMGEAESLEAGTCDMSLVSAILPYIVLSVVTLAVLAIRPNTNAGHFLLISVLVSMIYYRSRGYVETQRCKVCFTSSFKIIWKAVAATILMAVMSKIMSGTGQTTVLAEGMALVLGDAALMMTPFIGYVGTFMTGSNVNSNVLFGEFQYMAARSLGASVPLVLGAQTAGAAVGSSISPSKIILGTSTINSVGIESRILKIMLKISLPFVILMGVVIKIYLLGGI